MNYNYIFPYLNIPIFNLKDDYKKHIDIHGIVLLNVGVDFLDDNFINLMKILGNPIKENPNIGDEYIENEFILNIKTNIDKNISIENEPFSINGLRLHMERAFSDIKIQPNYIALFCLIAPVFENGGQTIVYNMKDFMSYFNESELKLMKEIYPISKDLSIVSPNPIFHFDKKRNLNYFSYRDLGVFNKDWFVKTNNLIDEQRIIDLVEKINKALYLYNNIYALPWIPGHLYIIDNKKFFHGRTEQKIKNQRHLKRIRVL